MASASGYSRAGADHSGSHSARAARCRCACLDNSQSCKEGVSRTYAGTDGYAPIGAYLGRKGWCVGLELREGRTHNAQERDHVLERVLPRAARLSDAPMLVRMDSGFDSGKLFGAIAAASVRRQRDGGAPIEIKRIK